MMYTRAALHDEPTPKPTSTTSITQAVRQHYEAIDAVRRGICLLNAGRHDKAHEAFAKAESFHATDQSLPSYLAACLIGKRHPAGAAEMLADVVADNESDTAARIRHSLTLWRSGQRNDAWETLRDGIAVNPESAALHFQLGTLLASVEKYEEAELRFTQAISIDRDHTEALVSLALCCGVRRRPAEALDYLQRAQQRKPHDARIGLLLAQAAKAALQHGQTVRLRAIMPENDVAADREGIEELSRVIEAEPDFVDAFLSIPTGEVNASVFSLLALTLEAALERQPEQAELHYHCGRVLERLGRREDAIKRNERAVEINPKFTRALIELGRLYQRTSRNADATTRLEQAIATGAEYADVYYALGGLYRDQGREGPARRAFEQALSINGKYDAAREALAALAV